MKIKRILAAVIDIFSSVFFSSIIVGILTWWKFDATPYSIAIYFLTFYSSMMIKDILFKNTSIGKRIFKLKVIRLDGGKLKLVDVIKRNLPIIVLLPLECYLIIVNNERIGDIWAKTSVVPMDYSR